MAGAADLTTRGGSTINCYQHVETPASGVCVSCGKAICAACANEIHEKLYCRNCVLRMASARATVSTSGKNKTAAGLLAIFLGSFGIHRFYLGDAIGILYLLFFWTGIPGIIGLVEGIIYLTMPDEEFYDKYLKPREQAAPPTGQAR